MSDSMRVSIYSRLDRLWSSDGYSGYRWEPIKREIIRISGGNPETKAGMRAARALKLDSKECADLVWAMSDDDLLDLYERTARQYARQM